MRLSDLKQKEVINIRTCRSLGYVHDLDIDCRSGCVLALFLPCPGKFGCFWTRECEYCIPWKCIVQIGTDIVLVDVEEEHVQKKNS